MQAPCGRIGALALAGLSLALVGCDTAASRIREKSAEFAALPPAAQAAIRKGIVQVGYTPDMVYLALGSPDDRAVETTAEGQSLVWIYTHTDEVAAGSGLVGVQMEVAHNASTKAPVVVSTPVYAPVYADHTEDRIRVTFRNGKVTAIERYLP
jgi:hypothetical protein